MGPFPLWKTLARLNSPGFGNGLLLVKLSSLTFGGSLRAADRNDTLFIEKVVSTKKSKVRTQQLPFEATVLFLALAGGGSVELGWALRLVAIMASVEKILGGRQSVIRLESDAHNSSATWVAAEEPKWEHAPVRKADSPKNRAEVRLE